MHIQATGGVIESRHTDSDPGATDGSPTRNPKLHLAAFAILGTLFVCKPLAPTLLTHSVFESGN